MTARIHLTAMLARTIADVAQRAALPASGEVVIEHRLESRGEVCTVSARRPVADLEMATF